MTFLPETFREEMRKLSFLSTGETSPNPPVSCLITDIHNRQILAYGKTSPTGGPHAERNAYDQFVKNGLAGTAHNVWVTLEPCTHHGKTPPCMDLILEHKPKTLYYGWKDPNPLVNVRQGLEEAKQNGIAVVQDSTLAQIASESLFGFASRIETKRPAMILKTAVSREGFFAAEDKTQIQLSGSLSSRLTSILRTKCDAVLVGPGTLYHDRPGLDFRPEPTGNSEVTTFSVEEESPIEDAGFSALLKNILKYANDSEIRKIHTEREAAYQPYRIFIIFEERNITEEWISKQKRINEKYGSKKCIFLIAKDAVLDHGTKEILLSLTEKEIRAFEPSRLAEECFEFFSELGINLLLVEGGNLLYKTFSPKMKKNDLILKILSTRSIVKGIEPALETNAKTLQWKTKVGEDIWEAHGCLQV
ncbi:bifunctional diaminohydroxyphosphoribosylaminopyrimidine deaminase/5-amino-6-(5-phosphoribosylamino)uracil reductase RibD [Leptospira barantonii]|uniref:Bifunctional diaminohydroxyphosphoribosylaminopyrimidine deaminase/5-amino-6-(5-phosphoribosylamino)uracil reductase n=1 Tax=Leptospira barantonii TaxID=2023184 RepID=A0ABX4NQN6_9LEPT|nr:bifunctional diaminohydroxyphosphoribosylaminopyrimidine deaminase/5-amino-6-(5-phosphoribosylamino)uracil reductase [Leptospira barantonii]PJZ58015.1 bifunctional diaminohydroxyphosphoribosylaminopyrimidine deaminase/5-amino-6-(5-phosphoribosylamino)uracil reductase [Leptospira barantonii]